MSSKDSKTSFLLCQHRETLSRRDRRQASTQYILDKDFKNIFFTLA